jgi:polyhydroxybutyrate depolymerase
VTEEVTLAVGDRPREYLLHVPGGTPGPARPAVLLLHGTGGTAHWAQEEARWFAFADRAGFVAVVPQGLPPDPDAPPKFIANPPAWNAGGTLFPGHAPDDLEFFAQLFADLPPRARVDPNQIFVTGFSNGASMAFELAAAMGERVAAIAPVAGYCRARRAAVPVPTLFIVGADDPIVPPDGGTFRSPWTGELKLRPPVWESLDRWAAALGCHPRREVLSDADGLRVERYPGPVEFRVMIVAGLGHHWPGGLGRLKRKLAGEPSERIDANEVIWQFFTTAGRPKPRR